MSWSQGATVTEDELLNLKPANPLTPEMQEQFDVALAAAQAIVASGAVGVSGKTYQVNLSGHANENHEPKSGWANDCITISITQRSPEPAPTQ